MDPPENDPHYNILEEHNYPNQRYDQEQKLAENSNHDSYYDRQNQYSLPSSNSYLHQPYSEHYVPAPSTYSSLPSSYYSHIPSSATSKNGGIYDWLLETYGDQQSNVNSINSQQSLIWSIGIAIFVILIFHSRDYNKRYKSQEYEEIEDHCTWQDKLHDYINHLVLYILSLLQTIYRFRFYILSPFEITRFNSTTPNSHSHHQHHNSYESSPSSSSLGEDAIPSNSSSRDRGPEFSKYSSDMPSLEPLKSNISSPLSNYTYSKKSTNTNEFDCHASLPSAFLTKEEYPEGWLVYDPKIGEVVSFEKLQ